MPNIKTFLMFDGKAEEAMNLYTTVFEKSEIISIARYGENEAGAEGTVLQAVFSINGQEFMCMDSSVKHDFTFTPSMSLYVTFETVKEVDRAFERLSQGGTILMPLAAYPFSKRFGWLTDPYGVSWQLNVAGSQ